MVRRVDCIKRVGKFKFFVDTGLLAAVAAQSLQIRAYWGTFARKYSFI